MKFKFLKKAVAFVTAVTMSLGMVTVMPEGVLPQIGVVVNAESSYESFNNIPCGEYATMSLSNGALTISGVGNMFEIALDNQLTGYSTYYDYRQNIGDYVKSITISNGITSIGSYAFSGFSALSSVTIPDTVESINAYAFSECTSLSNITIPQNTELSIYDDTIFAAANGNLIIYGYSNSSAEKYAAEYNIKFISLDSEDNISSNKCGDNAYWELSEDGILTISGTGEMWDYDENSMWSRYDLKKIIIGEGITSVGDDAFWCAYDVNSIELPSSLVTIGEDAFHSCGSFESYIASANLETIIIPCNVSLIDTGAFSNCGVKKIVINCKKVTIENSAFYGCRNLDNLTINGNISSLGASAFRACGLRNVTIPPNIGTIDSYVFAESSLEKITIEDGVTSIEYAMFDNCDSLSEVVIPQSVNSIDRLAFSYCDNLEKITIHNKNVSIGESVFSGSHKITLYGYIGSTTETYANENNIPFVALDPTSEFVSATITQNTNPIYIDDEFVFMVSALDSAGNSIDIPENVTYSYSISNPNVIEITDEGYVGTAEIGINAKAIGVGTTTITVTFSNGVSASASVTVEDDENTTDYTQYLKFEFNNAELIKFDYENGVFNPSSKEIKYYYGATLIDTTENQYGNDVILSNVTIKLIAPTGFSFDESGKQTTFSKNFEKLRLNTDDCSGTVTLYPQSYTYPTVTLKAEVYVDNVLYDSFDTKVGVTQKNTNAIDISEEYDETDTDGDGLPDVWEKYGITYNGDFLDLPAMGADPNVPDIFVEVDYKSGINISEYDNEFKMVVNQFKKNNINLHIDRGLNSIDFITGKKWLDKSRSNEILGTTSVEVYTKNMSINPTWKKLINNNFNDNPIRTLVFRYCILGDKFTWVTGLNAKETHGYAIGQYFYIACESLNGDLLKSRDDYSKDRRLQYATVQAFMHELGHTLGLGHGGIKENGKPNNDDRKREDYLSIMNYAYNYFGVYNMGTKYNLLWNEKGLTYSNEENDWGRLTYKIGKIGEYGGALDGYINDFMDLEITGDHDEIPIISPIEINHIANDEYYFDSKNHWKICSECGEKIDIAQHISNSGVVTVQPTATTTGVKTYACFVCGYVIRIETLPATGGSENNGGNGNTGSYVPPTTVPSYTPTFPATIVTRPTLTVKATTKNDTVTLKWNKINNAKKYTVYQLVNGKYVKIKDTDKTSVTFKKLKSGKTYKFLVKYTVNGQKSSNAYSGRISVTVNYKPVVKATATRNSVKLVWNDVPNAQKYAVYKYVNGKAVKLIETQKTSVKINKLAPKTKYQYIVRAYINGKWTTMTKSDIVTATTK